MGAVAILFCVVLWQRSKVEVQASRLPQTATRTSVSVSQPEPPAPAVPAPKPDTPTIYELRAAVSTLQDELIAREDEYETLQQGYEACAQSMDSPGGRQYNPEKSDPFYSLQATDDMGPMGEREGLNLTLAALKTRLIDYRGATGFLQDKYNGCKSGQSTSVCWGFWPRDTSKGLHWKAMPCDGG
jgi:hypothetical protein